jgi:hypothetical protein
MIEYSLANILALNDILSAFDETNGKSMLKPVV